MPATILLADNDPATGALIDSVSDALTANIVWARNGEEAYMRFQSAAPAVVVVAVDLPEVLGSVLCQRI